jgi:hypothetical protein
MAAAGSAALVILLSMLKLMWLPHLSKLHSKKKWLPLSPTILQDGHPKGGLVYIDRFKFVRHAIPTSLPW